MVDHLYFSQVPRARAISNIYSAEFMVVVRVHVLLCWHDSIKVLAATSWHVRLRDWARPGTTKPSRVVALV